MSCPHGECSDCDGNFEGCKVHCLLDNKTHNQAIDECNLARLKEDEEPTLIEKWPKLKEKQAEVPTVVLFKKILKFMEDNDYWQPKGVVEIILTEEKSSGYTSYQHCRIKGEVQKELYMRHKDEIIDHYWVWQTVGMAGDDYSGYMLLPLNKGQYLKVSYAC